MKDVELQPINTVQAVRTEDRLLDVLLAKKLDVLMSCGGKGLCATCHVRVLRGSEQLTPMTEREKRTLGNVTNCSANSRLACQCRVLGEGVTVQVPEGMYVERAEDLMSMLGKRAKADILHPVNAAVLIPKGKIITRSRLQTVKHLSEDVRRMRGED